MKNFFTKLPAKIGNFLLSALLLIGTLIVFGAGLYISWSHTYELAELAGLHGSLATAFTLFAEVVLCISEIVVIFKALMRKPIAASVYVGMVFGLLITLSANVISLNDNGMLGVLIGISIPLGTAIASWIFASALLETTTAKTTEEKPPIEVDEIATENIEDSHPKKREPNTPEIIEENHIVDTTEKVEEDTESTPEFATITTEKNDVELVDEVDQLEKSSTTDELAPEKEEPAPQEVAKNATKKKITKKKKNTAKVDDSTIEKVARELEKEHGELPGRKLLAQVAKCTEYRARNILAKLEPSPPEERPKLRVVGADE
jgi:hypothetical protein